MTDVKAITIEYLKKHKFDGLFSSGGECACLINDIFCCGAEGVEDCKPGYRIECDGMCEEGGGCEFHVGIKKAAP